MEQFRVLGIDPGYGRTGLGVIDFFGTEPKHVWHSVIETSSDIPFVDRIVAVRNDVMEAVRRFSPSVSCVESLFFQTNAKTAMNVGMARGAVLIALTDANVSIIDVTPNQVKQGVTGFGSADKKQVQEMVTKLLKLSDIPKPDDAADALALAIVGGYLFRVSKRRPL